MKDAQKVEHYLDSLGIAQGAITIYMELSKIDHPSVLQLANALDMSRTQAYRFLDQLKEYNLVSVEKLDHGTKYRSLPLENLEAVITERKAKLQQMQDSLGSMAQVFREQMANTTKGTTVRHYYGVSGLKQVNWNLTKAEGEYSVFESAHLLEHFDESFARRCQRRMTEKKLISYDLTNKTSVNRQDLEPFDESRTFYRHIDKNILNINFEMYIYNDTVTLLDYQADTPYAIEIAHPALTAMMRQIHQAIWCMGQPIKLQ